MFWVLGYRRKKNRRGIFLVSKFMNKIEVLNYIDKREFANDKITCQIRVVNFV